MTTMTFSKDQFLIQGVFLNHWLTSWLKTAKHMYVQPVFPLTSWGVGGGTTGSQDIPRTARTASLSCGSAGSRAVLEQTGYYRGVSLAGAAICSSTGAVTEL